MKRTYEQENKEFYALVRDLKLKYPVKDKVLVEKLKLKSISELTWMLSKKHLTENEMQRVIQAINPNLELVLVENSEGVEMKVINLD